MSRLSEQTAHSTSQTKAQKKTKNVTLKNRFALECLMESSKIENLIYVSRRLDQAAKQSALKDIIFISREKHLVLDASELLTSAPSCTLTKRIFSFDNSLSQRDKCSACARWYITLQQVIWRKDVRHLSNLFCYSNLDPFSTFSCL